MSVDVLDLRCHFARSRSLAALRVLARALQADCSTRATENVLWLRIYVSVQTFAAAPPSRESRLTLRPQQTELVLPPKPTPREDGARCGPVSTGPWAGPSPDPAGTRNRVGPARIRDLLSAAPPLGPPEAVPSQGPRWGRPHGWRRSNGLGPSNDSTEPIWSCARNVPQTLVRSRRQTRTRCRRWRRPVATVRPRRMVPSHRTIRWDGTIRPTQRIPARRRRRTDVLRRRRDRSRPAKCLAPANGSAPANHSLAPTQSQRRRRQRGGARCGVKSVAISALLQVTCNVTLCTVSRNSQRNELLSQSSVRAG